MKSTILLMALFTAFPMGSGAARCRESQRIDAANEVLEDIADIYDPTIPLCLLRDAAGLAIVPDVLRVGRRRWGQGVLLGRRAPGRWSAPAFVTFGGGSLGWQAGAQPADLVLIFRSRDRLESLQAGPFTLGVDATIAAGVVGRAAQNDPDAQPDAEILAYGRGKGFFTGVAGVGSTMRVDDAANARFYELKNLAAWQILAGQVCREPRSASQLRQTLERLTDGN